MCASALASALITCQLPSRLPSFTRMISKSSFCVSKKARVRATVSPTIRSLLNTGKTTLYFIAAAWGDKWRILLRRGGPRLKPAQRCCTSMGARSPDGEELEGLGLDQLLPVQVV